MALVPGDDIKKRNERVFYTYGRMNPPTIGHKNLILQMFAEAQEAAAGGDGPADTYVFPTSTIVPGVKNPLPVERKVDILKRILAETPEIRVISTTNCSIVGGSKGPCTKPQDVVEKLIEAGYAPENITLLVGEDERVGSFSFLKGRGITVRAIKAPRVKGSLSATGISGTNMREAAAAGNIERFRKGVNRAIPDEEMEKLIGEIVVGMARKKGGGRTRRPKKLSRSHRGSLTKRHGRSYARR